MFFIYSLLNLRLYTLYYVSEAFPYTFMGMGMGNNFSESEI